MTEGTRPQSLYEIAAADTADVDRNLRNPSSFVPRRMSRKTRRAQKRYRKELRR